MHSDDPAPATHVVLTTLNARYHHASLALRTLAANLGSHALTLAEFTINDAPVDIVERLLALRPRVIGLSVYIWNVRETTEVLALLGRLAPDITLVLGGPEVSHELDPRLAELAHHVIQGEGEVALRDLLDRLGAGETAPKIIAGTLPPLHELALPYDLYTDEDIAHRTLYVEASRGCPYRCEFCLSSLDREVRHVPIDRFLAAMQRLLDRGALHFKFIDRTFNLRLELASQILEFFLERLRPDLLLHFELVPDRLPDGLRATIARFPPGVLQFEVGIQTLDDQVGVLISRRQNVAKIADNLAFLRHGTGVHVHADLIIGLPGETLASFGAGLDRLWAMGPHEIQVGILKRLRGAPIARHTQGYALVFAPTPPYEVMQTSTLDFATLQRLKRFAHVWDRLVNRGNLPTASRLLFPDGAPFAPVLSFSEHLHQHDGRVHAISLDRLAAALADYLVARGVPPDAIAAALGHDYASAGRKLPVALRADTLAPTAQAPTKKTVAHRARQDRHRAS